MSEIQSGVGEVEHQENREAGHMDITQNVSTYHVFLRLTKWSLITCIVTLVLLAIFVV